MEFFVTFNSFQQLANVTKNSILDLLWVLDIFLNDDNSSSSNDDDTTTTTNKTRIQTQESFFFFRITYNS